MPRTYLWLQFTPSIIPQILCKFAKVHSIFSEHSGNRQTKIVHVKWCFCDYNFPIAALSVYNILDTHVIISSKFGSWVHHDARC